MRPIRWGFTWIYPMLLTQMKIQANIHVGFFFWSGVRLSSLDMSATIWPIVPASGDISMEQSVERKLARESEVLGQKLALVPLCPSKIPHDLTGDRPRAAAMGSRRLTAWAMARPAVYVHCHRVAYRRMECRLWISSWVQIKSLRTILLVWSIRTFSTFTPSKEPSQY
jgi:hypothetical protein